MELLTPKQEAVLKYIEKYQLKHGSSPTIREMREHFNLSSDNSILKHLKALEEKGYIDKDDTPRGIKILDSVKKRLESETIKLPLLGFIPAGGPVMSEEYIDSWYDVGPDIAQKQEGYFLLKVVGESMIDAGIFEDDIVVVNSKQQPRNGDIVVGLVDGANTVKRYMVGKNGPYLKAENPSYSDIYPEEELSIQGVVTGLLRYYK
ncbi:transcriptional repressor LexA [Candidatus Peregrinibacteria bacterium]|nr:transcriptional repressor LexA [Candidatus Peregrinibacteria bacterium]